MIIGINGKIGSGKDTIGDIIQKICITNNGPEFEVKKFAGKLKQIASLLTGIPVEKFEDQEFKKTLLSPEWGTVRPNVLNTIPVFENVQFNEMMSVRELLQKLGTEAMRDGLHTNVWVNALFADYRLWSDGSKDWYPNWIITDMRFPNELEAVKEKEGITILVQRPCQECGITISHSHICSKKDEILHASETGLDDSEFDYYISNDGTIEDLIEKVKEILIKEQII
jgi:hypothetical protein